MNISEISKSNAERLGEYTNRLQTIEECGELIKAICKYNRVLGHGQKTETTYKEALTNLIDEIADVSICIEQMIYLNDIESAVRDAKLRAFNKVANRLNGSDIN